MSKKCYHELRYHVIRILNRNRMTPRYAKLLLFVVIVFIIYKAFRHYGTFDRGVESELNTLQKLKISVYYEALCPDSKFFIKYQLLPVYEEFQEHVMLDLVPYGKAQTIELDNKIEFTCQHDSVECFANKIHSCAIEYVKDPLLQLKYIACMITDNLIPDDAGDKCAQQLNIDFKPILDCANDLKGCQLLKYYGERTNSLSPSVRFIPTIELNGNQNIIPQSMILKDLYKSVCQVLNNKLDKCK